MDHNYIDHNRVSMISESSAVYIQCSWHYSSLLLQTLNYLSVLILQFPLTVDSLREALALDASETCEVRLFPFAVKSGYHARLTTTVWLQFLTCQTDHSGSASEQGDTLGKEVDSVQASDTEPPTSTGHSDGHHPGQCLCRDCIFPDIEKVRKVSF